MFKLLFNTKVLGTLVLAIFFSFTAPVLNELNAQVQDSELGSPLLTQDDIADFEEEYEAKVQQIEDNTSYTETEKGIRLFYYDQIQQKINSGYGIEDAIEAAIPPTREYATKHKEGDRINFIALVREAKQWFL